MTAESHSVSAARPSGAPRRILLALLIVAPLAALVVAWLLVDALLLTPATPTVDAPPADVVRYIAHEKGLPRRTADGQREFLEQLAARVSGDEAFRSQFNSALQRLPEETRRAFRENLFRAFKPVILGDARRFRDLTSADARQRYLDDRIVHYNRGRGAFQSARLDRSILGGLTVDKDSLLRLILTETTAEERAIAMIFINAYSERIREIGEDEALRAEFARRTAGND